MNLYYIVGIAAIAAVGLIVLGWKMWYRAGKTAGKIEQQADDSNTARNVEQATAQTQLREMSDEEYIKRIRERGGA